MLRLRKYAHISTIAKDIVKTVEQRFKFSIHDYHSVMRVVRTTADLDTAKVVSNQPLAEWVSFRLVSATET